MGSGGNAGGSREGGKVSRFWLILGLLVVWIILAGELLWYG